jgi:hypothetical protein
LSEDDDKPKPTKGLKPPIRREAPEAPKRGFKVVDETREERNKITRPPWKVVAWFALPLLVALALYFRWDSNRIEAERQELMARQRAVEAELGTKWYPLRDTVESFAGELAAGPSDDLIAADDLAKLDFQNQAGIYLRLSADQTKDAASVRAAASKSLRDGFTACLMHTSGDDPFSGKECKLSRECDAGQLCNEFLHCAKPGQPYNLRLAYKALFVLTPEWVRDVQDADGDLRLRALKLTFDDANALEFPVAVDLLTKAKFFLVLVDERTAPADAAADDEEVLSGKTWATRIGLYRLADKKLLLRLRREAKGSLMGGSPVADSSVAAARVRQARSCELALDVRRALGDPSLEAPGPAPTDGAAPSASAPAVDASAAPSASSAPSASASAPSAPSAAPSAKP